MFQNRWVRGALAGSVALLVANLLSNVLFFQLGRGLILNPNLQSDKLIAVMTRLEPLPLMFTNGLLYLFIGLFVGAAHGIVFAFLAPCLPATTLKRGVVFGLILWALMALYFEFHVPFNMFGEPVLLVALELCLWIIVLLVEGILISVLYGNRA